MPVKSPIAISYRPKKEDYLPVVVASIRHHLGDWPIALICELKDLPQSTWLERNAVRVITDWQHSAGANKVLRFWEHQDIFARYYDSWIWWHDDMLLLRPVTDPVEEFSRPIVARKQGSRPNRKLSNWRCWLWDTLDFLDCQNIPAPNPVLHVPRLIRRDSFTSIPAQWNRSRLLFEPTYLLWHWHQLGIEPRLTEDYRKSVFKGEMPMIAGLQAAGYTVLNWGRKIDHESARRELGRLYPLTFE
jgi:hypothetical protein